MAHLDAVRVAPVIFQEFIPAESDLRITAVGGTLFAAAIRSVARDGLIDFRMSVGDAALSAEPSSPSADRTVCVRLAATGARMAQSTCAGRRMASITSSR